MGEWSEYFEQFPELDPANQKREPDLGPMSITFPHLHTCQLTKEELAIEYAKIREINAEAEQLDRERVEFVKDAKSKPIYKLEICPICRIKAMNIYKVSDDLYYCECDECHVSGDGSDITNIFAEIEYQIWTNES